MTNAHEKSPAPVAAGTGENENLGEDISMSNQPTRPAVTQWNRAVSEEAIPEALDTCTLRWGDDLERQPDWAAFTSRTGAACSDPVTVNAQQYDEDSPDNRGRPRTTRGKVKVTVVQGAEDAFPSVLIEVLKLGRTSKGNRALGTTSTIRLYSHELPALIEALSAAWDLVDEECK